MKKTGDLLKTNIARVDLTVEVLDARIPLSGLNPFVEEIVSRKPVLYVLNKADLADECETRRWLSYFREKKNAAAVVCCAVRPQDAKRVTAACFALCPEAKTGRRGVRALITGIPNAGKSTLINTLCGAAKAKTGDRPAVTKTLQRILTPGGLDLYDTPGILWHKFENRDAAYRLAATGAVRDEVLNLPDIALYTIEFLQNRYRDPFAQRFALGGAAGEAPSAVLEKIALKRGCAAKGGGVDREKAAAVFLREVRAGKVGRLTFDRVEEAPAFEAADGV